MTILPFADLDTSKDVYDYIVGGGAVWNLPLWRTETGVGSEPWIPGTHLGLRWASYRHECRYVIVALAHRTDCSFNDDLAPWLKSAVVAAKNSSRPHNAVAQ